MTMQDKTPPPRLDMAGYRALGWPPMEILCDGIKCDTCYEYDIEVGYIKAYDLDSNGRLYLDHGEVAKKVLRGEITVKFTNKRTTMG